jgi:hypothetical protein
MCYDVLWCVVMRYDVLRCVVMRYDVLWCVVMRCDVLWCVVMCCDVLWCVTYSYTDTQKTAILTTLLYFPYLSSHFLFSFRQRCPTAQPSVHVTRDSLPTTPPGVIYHKIRRNMITQRIISVSFCPTDLGTLASNSLSQHLITSTSI